MRKLLLILLLCFYASCALADDEAVGIAATVNNDVITSSDVMARVNLAIQGARMQPDEKTLSNLRKQALDALIDEQIRIQEIKRLGLTATDEEVNDAFGKIAEQNQKSSDEFKEALSSVPGAYQSLLRQIQTQIGWGNLVKRKIRQQINVSEEDITAYLTEKEKNPAKIEYKVAEIFLRKNDSNKEIADKLVADLRSGQQHFSAIARQFSQGLEASKGGLLGWIPEGTLEPILDKAIAATKQGMITDVIESSRGLHVFLVLDKRDVLPFKDASQRLHLKQLMVPLPAQLDDASIPALEQQGAALQQKAVNCAAVDALIAQINQPLSRDMGDMRMGDLPAPVLAVVKDLGDERISQPLRTPQGLAMYMICGRTTDAADKMREDVGNLLGNERMGRLQYRYYRDLRAAAYVDIRQ